MKAGPPMPMTVDGQRVLLASSAGELDRSQVVSVSLSMDQPKVAQSILLERFGVQDGEAVTKAAYGGLVDAYGQSTRAKWPEKVSSDEQLKSAAAKEQQQLKTWLAEREKSSLDKFGGLDKGPAFKASGFFRTEKRDGRWYLVTPEGHPFYSLGVNTVTPDVNQTYIAGREWMFESLPKPDERAGQPLWRRRQPWRQWRRSGPWLQRRSLVRLLWRQPAASVWRTLCTGQRHQGRCCRSGQGRRGRSDGREGRRATRRACDGRIRCRRSRQDRRRRSDGRKSG